MSEVIQGAVEAVKAAKDVLPVAAQYPSVVALVCVFLMASGAIWVALAIIKQQSKTGNRQAESLDASTKRYADTIDTLGKAVDASGRKTESINVDVESLKKRIADMQEQLDDLREIKGMLREFLGSMRKAG